MSASEPSPTHTTSSIEDLESMMLDGEFSDSNDRDRFGAWAKRILVGSSLVAVAVCIAAGVRALSAESEGPVAPTDLALPTFAAPDRPVPDQSEPEGSGAGENHGAPGPSVGEPAATSPDTEPVGSGAGQSHGAPGPTSEEEAEATWYAECVDKGWPDVQEHCGSCTARVSHAKYNHTCDNYCTSIGQYCAGAWEPAGDGCDSLTISTCSTAMLSANAAVCQCVKTEQKAACAPHRGSCLETKCCASITDTCFEKNDGWYGCRSSCAPGKPDHMDGPEWQQPWSCTQPHARPEARARETSKWPDIVAVCSTGEVLVDPHAFAETYGSDCWAFCRDGAARDQIGAEHWISMVGKGSNVSRTCPGDYPGTQNWGVFCSCSFPDRL